MKELVMTMSQECMEGTELQDTCGVSVSDVDWNSEATRFLKSVLARYGVSNSELIAVLAENGVRETQKGLEAKLRRGAFSAAYLLQCVASIGVDRLEYVGPCKRVSAKPKSRKSVS